MATSSFWSAFKTKAETDIKIVVKEVETVLEYGANAAITNIKAEAAKLDSLITAKTDSIIAHNKNILNEQNLIKDLEAAVAEAQTLKTKIESIL